MKHTIHILLLPLLAAGCQSFPAKQPERTPPSSTLMAQSSYDLSPQAMAKLAVENVALVEWQIARLTAACDGVANADVPAAIRREALRLKAAYASSCYSIATGPNALAQVLDLLAMAALSQQLWIEDGGAKAQFGDHGKGIEAAFAAIHSRMVNHASKQLSPAEIRGVEETVRDWRKSHPGPMVVEFIRFDAFANQLATSLAGTSGQPGIIARIRSAAHNAEMVGERALLLASRMPQLTEWHAEAAAASLLAQADVRESLSAVKQLAALQTILPDQVRLLQSQLAALPAELTAAVGKQPELQAALTQLEQSQQRLRSLETSIKALDDQVGGLAAQIGHLGKAVQPEVLQSLVNETGQVALSRGRSLISLATICLAGLLVLHAVLRRLNQRPPPQA